jgi:NitT/TauT family transport system substrate-binding protein
MDRNTADSYRSFLLITALLLLLTLSASVSGAAEPNGRSSTPSTTVRVGHLPNITHPQALIGRANAAFEKALAPDARVEWKAFNAGPSVIEALFAGEIDLAYLGPSPVISGYVRSQGDALRVVAGATSGGAALVVRSDSGIQKPQDFHGKKVATPQFGNTQDIALRAWLDSNGLKARERGGDVQIIPIANADQLTLFQRKQIDAAWAPEPWASRLIREGNGRLLVDEREVWPNHEFSSTLLVASRKFLSQHPDLVKRWLRTHVELTQWATQNTAEAKRVINAELQRETGKALPADIIDSAWARLRPTIDPIRSSVALSAKRGADLGLLGRSQPDINGLFDLTLLNQVLTEKRLPAIP